MQKMLKNLVNFNRLRNLNLLFLFFILILTNKTFGQVNDSVKKYYNFRNQAELFIVNKKYNLAEKSYLQAFKYIKNPFLRDKYNLALCCAYQKKKKKCYNYLQELIEYGFPIDSLQKIKVFGKVNFMKLSEIKNFKFNTEYRRKLDSLYKREQQYRGDQKENKDSIIKIDASNVRYLNQLIEKFGFPSEKNVGTYPNFNYKSFNIIVVHNFTGVKYHQNFDYSSLLTKAVERGEIDNLVAVYLILGSKGIDDINDTYTGLIAFAIYDANEPTKIKKNSMSPFGFIKLTNLDEINYKRQQMCLDSLSDLKKKILFQIDNNNFKLTASGTYKKVFVVSAEDYEKRVSSLNFEE
jgi:hypothetical protein